MQIRGPNFIGKECHLKFQNRDDFTTSNDSIPVTNNQCGLTQLENEMVFISYVFNEKKYRLIWLEPINSKTNSKNLSIEDLHLEQVYNIDKTGIKFKQKMFTP